jgi:hypothetical protein
MKHPALLLTLCLVAGACTPKPFQTLDQKLAGKDAAERKKLLRVTCLDEAEWPQKSSIPKGASIKQRAHNDHYLDSRVEEMKHLCKRMDALGDPDAEDKQDRGVLIRECADLVRQKQKETREGFAQHAARTQHICEEMLGQEHATPR